MKLYLIALALLVLSPVVAQNPCSQFYQREVGKTQVIHQFDKRENLSTITRYTVTAADDMGMTIAMSLSDKRDRPITEASFKALCAGGTTRLDPRSIMSAQIQQYEGMEYSITGDDISIPNELTIGQTLPDAEVTMVVDSGMINITSTVTMTDRKVERTESVTTPAGTFECFVITYTNTLSMGISRTMYTTQWIASGIGMVKEETKKRNGNLVTKSILHTIN